MFEWTEGLNGLKSARWRAVASEYNCVLSGRTACKDFTCLEEHLRQCSAKCAKVGSVKTGAFNNGPY